MADDTVTRSDLEGFVREFVAKNGGEQKALEVLSNETLKLRRKLADVRQQLQDAQTKATPDGALVLTGADAAEYEALKALGSAKEVQAKLAAGDDATARLTGIRQEQAARAAGYKPSVLTDLAKAKGFAVEVRDETVDGETKTVPYAKPADGPAVPLTEYVEKHLADYLPALSATPAPPSAPTPTPSAPAYPAAPLRTAHAPGGPSDAELRQQKAASVGLLV